MRRFQCQSPQRRQYSSIDDSTKEQIFKIEFAISIVITPLEKVCEHRKQWLDRFTRKYLRHFRSQVTPLWFRFLIDVQRAIMEIWKVSYQNASDQLWLVKALVGMKSTIRRLGAFWSFHKPFGRILRSTCSAEKLLASTRNFGSDWSKPSLIQISNNPWSTDRVNSTLIAKLRLLRQERPFRCCFVLCLRWTKSFLFYLPSNSYHDHKIWPCFLNIYRVWKYYRKTFIYHSATRRNFTNITERSVLILTINCSLKLLVRL